MDIEDKNGGDRLSLDELTRRACPAVAAQGPAAV